MNPETEQVVREDLAILSRDIQRKISEYIREGGSPDSVWLGPAQRKVLERANLAGFTGGFKRDDKIARAVSKGSVKGFEFAGLIICEAVDDCVVVSGLLSAPRWKKLHPRDFPQSSLEKITKLAAETDSWPKVTIPIPRILEVLISADRPMTPRELSEATRYDHNGLQRDLHHLHGALAEHAPGWKLKRELYKFGVNSRAYRYFLAFEPSR